MDQWHTDHFLAINWKGKEKGKKKKNTHTEEMKEIEGKKQKQLLEWRGLNGNRGKSKDLSPRLFRKKGGLGMIDETEIDQNEWRVI